MTNDLAIKILMGDVLGTTEQTHEAVEMAVKALLALPSANAVNVVRCEQCKHYNNIDFHCYYHGSICFKPNDYCPYGEVRNGG